MKSTLALKKGSLLALLLLAEIIGLFLLKKYDLISSYPTLLILIGVLFPIDWFALLLFLPSYRGKKLLRSISLLLVSSSIALIALLVDKDSILRKIDAILSNASPIIKNNLKSSDLLLIAPLSILLIALIVLNYLIQDYSAMKINENSFNSRFPEKEFNQHLKAFCNSLQIQLNQLDIDSNWSDAHFTPLEAEVEIQFGNRKKRRITNLLDAIRKDKKSRTFLVLGDPGSGKSVALRKLSKDLLLETPYTYRIPIYINLKEWHVPNKWTENSPPTFKELYEFVISRLKGRDMFTDDFIDKYFKRLFENGHLFFVFDSFDEIPAVLDEDESSWLIDKLSEVLYTFLSGAHDSRGILASRTFRKPSLRFQSKTILDIRPFSELKIENALRSYVHFDQNLINELFTKRSELIPIASNPFSIGLLYNYTRDNLNSLPLNQSELYSSYIGKRLLSCKDKIEKLGLDSTQILNCAIEIANYMFEEQSLGLEASVRQLCSQFQESYNVESIIEILVYAKIGRVGSGPDKRFSFVHRRFNEYFVIGKILNSSSPVDLESIPMDSRYRDVLVLYCEVAPINQAKIIAEFCWAEISKLKSTSINDPQYLRVVHCLRFIKEAFRARPECLESFRGKLADLIETQIHEHKEVGNILLIKLCVEAVGLLDSNSINKCLIEAFSINNSWISDTAIKSCRHLPKLDLTLEKKISNYIDTFDTLPFFKKKEEFLFSLKLSDGFDRIYKRCKIKSFDNFLVLLG
ncbi:MAG TPA: NACHT domain-containing protein, partial [Bacteroidia bacterium]|nr:NACHT domain-containing protein [Bacteroidia bacterium]